LCRPTLSLGDRLRGLLRKPQIYPLFIKTWMGSAVKASNKC